MSEIPSYPLNRWWYFISRLFIIGGMMLFFSSVAYILSAYVCNWLFGINLIEQPGLVNQFESNPNVLKTVKLLQVVLTIGMMVVPALLFPKAIERKPASFLQLTTAFKPIHLGLGLLTVIAATPMVSWMVEVNAQLSFPPSLADWEASLKTSEELAAQLTKAFVSGTTYTDLALNLIIVAIVPAIAEELLFRGAIQQFVRLVFGNIHVAIMVTAIMFSAFHGQIYGFLPRFALGILLGYLFTYSGSIWPAIVAHFFNNALSVCISYFDWDEQTSSILSETYHFNSIWVTTSVAVCTLIVITLYKTRSTYAASMDKSL